MEAGKVAIRQLAWVLSVLLVAHSNGRSITVKHKHLGKSGHGPAVSTDFQLEAIAEIIEGKRLVHCHSYKADEILAMLRIADDFKFKIATFHHVLEGYKVANEMAAHGAGGSTFSDWWGYKI